LFWTFLLLAEKGGLKVELGVFEVAHGGGVLAGKGEK
jgi:hypothetical protein